MFRFVEQCISLILPTLLSLILAFYADGILLVSRVRFGGRVGAGGGGLIPRFRVVF